MDKFWIEKFRISIGLLLVQSLAGVKNGVPFALLFTRVASDAQLLLLKKHYGTFCKEYGNIGFDYLKVLVSILFFLT